MIANNYSFLYVLFPDIHLIEILSIHSSLLIIGIFTLYFSLKIKNYKAVTVQSLIFLAGAGYHCFSQFFIFLPLELIFVMNILYCFVITIQIVSFITIICEYVFGLRITLEKLFLRR